MKFLGSGLLLASFVGVVYGGKPTITPAECEGASKQTCTKPENTGICHYEITTGNCHTKVLDADHAYPGTLGGYCDSVYQVNPGTGKEKYMTPQGGIACGTGLMCFSEIEPVDGEKFRGVCEKEKCYGKQDPEWRDDTLENEATIRVTICHRTCSETNPWVRITIDDDAWNGTACWGVPTKGGHEAEHWITDDCSKYGPDWTAWGENRKDYLIKWHGTREFVRQDNKWGTSPNGQPTAEEKAYWFYWERACPYVRHKNCCGTLEKGPCCGDNPYPYLSSTIQLEKKVIPKEDKDGNLTPNPCAFAHLMDRGDNDLEEYVGYLNQEVVYAYEAKNTGNVPLCHILLSDTEISTGNFENFLVNNVEITEADGVTKKTMTDGCLQPNERFCMLMPNNGFSTIPGLEAKAAKVVATPIGVIPGGTGDVSDTNTAGVDVLKEESAVIPLAITLEKKVGPVSAVCPNAAFMTSGDEGEEYTDGVGETFSYFYLITNPEGSPEVCNIKLSDPDINTGGFSEFAVSGELFNEAGSYLMPDGCLKPGKQVCVASPQINPDSPSIPADGEKKTATVTGTNQAGTDSVTDTNDAAVLPVEIKLEKFVIAEEDYTQGGQCPLADKMYELYVDAPGTTVGYAYRITNTGDKPLCNILLSDPALSDGVFENFEVMPDGCLPPGESICVLGPSPSSIPNTDEDEKDVATVVAMPEGETGPENQVSSQDPAGVLPTSIDLQKKVLEGAPDAVTCPVDMSDPEKDEVFAGPPGTVVTYCYTVTNTGLVDLCHIFLKDPNLINGAFGTEGSGVELAESMGLNMVGGCLAPGESVTYKSGSSISSDEESKDAFVEATPSLSPEEPTAGLEKVTDQDPATVIPAQVLLEKKVELGEQDACPLAELMEPNYEPTELASGFANDVATYYYKITNVGVATLCNFYLSDPDIAQAAFSLLSITGSIAGFPDGTGMENGCLPPGASICLAAPNGVSAILENEKELAEVKATPSKPDGTALPNSGDVTSKDDAGVQLMVENFTQETSPPLEDCPAPMPSGNLDADLCNGAGGIVRLLEVTGSEATKDYIRSVESTLLYDIDFTASLPVVGYGIQFKVNNPFGTKTDVYVQFQKPVEQENVYGDECWPQSFDTGCPATGSGTLDDAIAAQCVKPHTAPGEEARLAHTFVDVYFVTSDFLADGSTSNMAECCESKAADAEGMMALDSNFIVKATFFLYCECPDTSMTRNLLRGRN